MLFAQADSEKSTTENTKEATRVVWQSLIDMWNAFLERLPFLLIGVAVLIVTAIVSWAAQSLARRVMVNRRIKRGLRDLILQLLAVAIWVTGLVIAAVVIFPGMTPAKVLAGLGIGSVALGFAFKDIVENFLAGVLILWSFPFDPGDYIECGDIKGEVEEVTIRMTLVRQTDGELVVVPNAQLFKNPVNVLTSQPLRRITVICGVAYDEDVDQSREVIKRAVESCELVSPEKNVEIFAQEFGASSINFEVTWWCRPTPLEVRESRDQVVAAVKRALDDAGIEIPFPYRTLTFKEALPLADEREDGDENRDQ